jgi:hypothetical protein
MQRSVGPCFTAELNVRSVKRSGQHPALDGPRRGALPSLAASTP